MAEMDPMLEIYIYENQQLLDRMEEILLHAEKEHSLTGDQINEIFRIMHTIKGSSSMMYFDTLAHVSHEVENMFSQIREYGARGGDWDHLFDIVLGATDFIKGEIAKLQNGGTPDGEANELVASIEKYLSFLSMRKDYPKPEELPQIKEKSAEEADLAELDFTAQNYKIKVFFEADCKMENIRAFGIVNALTDMSHKIEHVPENVLDDESSDEIVSNGFLIFINSPAPEDNLRRVLSETMFVKNFELEILNDESPELPASMRKKAVEVEATAPAATAPTEGATKPSSDFLKQNFISVNINKLDKLMNLVGEIVTTESMVIKNPDLVGLKLNSFEKATQQLQKLTDELQDIVMSIRMVPVSATFHKMQRIVRDIGKKISKEADLIMLGEETEVDKTIIDNLSDPLMHLIRNSLDHGLEMPEDRLKKNKPPKGKIFLEAQNTGGDVIISVRDDGRGLNRQLLLKKAAEKGLLTKAEADMSDREVYSLIFTPGFSTKDQATELSGRGVGMDVVRRNIDNIGGSIVVDSTPNVGMSITIRIPLTLAIIEGMMLSVGNTIFIAPILSIRESFKPAPGSVFSDPQGNEMIMIRGQCHEVISLHKFFHLETETKNFEDGILVVVETDSRTYCIFVDKLLGKQPAVVKPMPSYIAKSKGRLKGLAGCTIMGDGSIGLILDFNTFVN